MKDLFKDLPETDLRSGQRKRKICGDLADTGNQCDWCRDCGICGSQSTNFSPRIVDISTIDSAAGAAPPLAVESGCVSA